MHRSGLTPSASYHARMNRRDILQARANSLQRQSYRQARRGNSPAAIRTYTRAAKLQRRAAFYNYTAQRARVQATRSIIRMGPQSYAS